LHDYLARNGNDVATETTELSLFNINQASFCLILNQADNVTGKIAKLINLKMPIFLSRLSDSQKISAASDLQKCTSVEFIWPQPFTQYKGAEMYIAEGIHIFQIDVQINKID